MQLIEIDVLFSRGKIIYKTLAIDWGKVYTIYHVIDFKALRFIKPNHFMLHNVKIIMF